MSELDTVADAPRARAAASQRVARYQLLELVGSGGMGDVWGAWDPELERRVALKLHKARPALRERMLHEGQALAKLSHPNVVPIYDVGIEGEQLYLVMEWIKGTNLRAYQETAHSVRDVLDVYRAAGEGLAAAHRAGLIHRDFKPDNAILGEDGRVRVLDFGLARGGVAPDDKTSGSAITRGVGTPRYMPPEQAEGRELTPAVDQYAFCASLREALVCRTGDDRLADVPAWIDKILDKGTAHAPENRYASMTELLAALARDPRVVLRRRLLAVGALLAVAATFAIGMRAGGRSGEDRCRSARAEIDSAWNATSASRVRAHLAGLGPFGAENADRVAAALSRYSARWATAREASCRAREHGDATAAMFENTVRCLGRARVAFETIVDVFANVKAPHLSDAIVAERGLPAVEICATQTSTVEPPPKEIAATVIELDNAVSRARMLQLAGSPDALAVAEKAAIEAERLHYAPLVARAALVLGHVQMAIGRKQDAVRALGIAMTLGFEVGEQRVAVEAYARQIYAIATGSSELAELKDRLGGIELAESIAKSLGPAGGFERALLYNNIGTVKLADGDRAAARRWFSASIKERDLFASRHVELIVATGNLALVTDDTQDRARLFDEQAVALDRELGPTHPQTLGARVNAAMFVAHPEQALAALTELCPRLEMHTHLPEKIEVCRYEAAWLAYDLGRPVTWPRGTHYLSEIAQGYRAFEEGNLDAAVKQFVTIGKRLGASTDRWERYRSLDAHIGLAKVHLRRHDSVMATVALEAALQIADRLKHLYSAPYFQRRVARIQTMLAPLIAGRERTRSEFLEEQARAWYREAGYP